MEIVASGPWLAVLLLALSGFSLMSYSLRILDATGAVVSFVLGLVIVLAGGLGWLMLIAVFTGLAFIATRVGMERKRELGLLDRLDGERGVSNVVGNGLAPALAALMALVVDPGAAAFAFAAAVAAIAADTMGSEIGCMSSRARRITPPWPRERAGTNGAVSWLGQGAAAVGAVVIAAASALLLPLPSWQAWVAAGAGFVGSQLDSVLGATLERDERYRARPLSKQHVNFLASFVPGAAVLAYATLAL